MNLGLVGTSALVCGASQGLGLAIAQALAEEGCRVGLLARSRAKLDSQVADFAARGHKAVGLVADMGDWPSVAAALDRFGPPAILVNNTGGPPLSPATDVDADLWRRQFDAMVLNQMRLTTTVLPAMRAARFGRILSVMSTTVEEPIAGLSISGTLRAALANWMKNLAHEVAADGITVNTLLTGSFATERIDRLNAAEAAARGIGIEQVMAETCATIPARRYGDPREFASVAAFLAGRPASYVTGAMIRVDGGATRAV